MPNIYDEFVERAAAQKHERWAEWQESVFSKCELQPDGSLLFPKEEVRRRCSLINTRYKDLTEEEKEKDRYEARLMIPILKDLLSVGSCRDQNSTRRLSSVEYMKNTCNSGSMS